MKFCYIDESGTGSEPIAVMIGVVVDSQRMGPTKRHWDQLLDHLSVTAGKRIDEFHTKDFYPGNAVWHNVSGEKRSEITDQICDWIKARRHHFVMATALRAECDTEIRAGILPKDIKNIWMMLATHIILSLQREGQKNTGTKGNTVLIFDEHEIDKNFIQEFVNNPPAWSDSYYEKGKKQPRLDQIVDIPYFCDSKHVGLVQLADFAAFFIRRHLEIAEGRVPEKYNGEKDKISKWVTTILGRTIPISSIYPKTGRCEISEMYYRLAPVTARTF